MNRGVEIDGRGHCPNGDSVPKPLGFYAFRPGFQIRGAGVAGTLESRRPGRRSGCVPAEPCPPPGRTYINSSNNGIIDILLPLDVSTMCPAQSVHHGPVHSLLAGYTRIATSDSPQPSARAKIQAMDPESTKVEQRAMDAVRDHPELLASR